MPAITALIHTCDDALRLGRVLETLHPCDDILVVDHGSHDRTLQIAREYGARIIDSGELRPDQHPKAGVGPWLLCLDPHESLSESLVATLWEWKSAKIPSGSAYSLHLREETPQGWFETSTPQTRLIPAGWKFWSGTLPSNDESTPKLEGHLLRFSFP